MYLLDLCVTLSIILNNYIMKKVFTLLVLVLTFASCTLEEINNENTTQNEEFACPAPDTNCDGIPDHEQ